MLFNVVYVVEREIITDSYERKSLANEFSSKKNAIRYYYEWSESKNYLLVFYIKFKFTLNEKFEIIYKLDIQ